MFLHLTEQAKAWGSLRMWWCYSDEGAIGLAVDIAETTHPNTLAEACFDKYMARMAVESRAAALDA